MKRGDRVLVQVGYRNPRMGTVFSPVASSRAPNCATVNYDGCKSRYTVHHNFLTVVEGGSYKWIPELSERVIWRKGYQP